MNKDKVLRCRCDEVEKAYIEVIAKDHGITVSQLLLRSAMFLGDMEESGKFNLSDNFLYRRMSHFVCGL